MGTAGAVVLLTGNPPGRTRSSPDVSSLRASCQEGSNLLSFVSTRTGREQIYLLDVRRPEHLTQITTLPGFVMDPAWSPDGRRVAFRWFRPNTDTVGVYVADADGSSVRLLAEPAGMPDWSPDGRSIAFANLDPEHRGISVAEVDDALAGEESAVRIVTEADADVPEEAPAWSPDGARIAFTSQRSGSSDVWVVDADGTHMRDLTPKPSLDDSPAWSPDGRHILFGSDRASHSPFGGDLFSMRPDGTNVRRLTREGHNYAPAWSPDGRWIAFNSQRDGNSEVYVMRPDGTGQRRLTDHLEADGIAAWVGDCSRRARVS